MDLRSILLRISTARVISQVIFFLLFNAFLFGFESIPLLLPVLQSSGTSQTTVGDAFAAIQYALYETTFPWLPLASFLIFVILLGRALCAWTCPFGFIQDILGFIKRRQTELSPRTHENLLYIKYLVLGLVSFISITIAVSASFGAGGPYRNALGIFAQAPFNVLSPHDSLFALLPMAVFNAISMEAPFQNILGSIGSLSPLFWTRVFILILVLGFAFYTARSWCRYFCPVGAAMSLFSNFTFLGLKRELVRCTKEGCHSCVDVCPMKVPILDLPWEKFTHPECTYCLKCVDACGTKAIRPKIP